MSLAAYLNFQRRRKKQQNIIAYDGFAQTLEPVAAGNASEAFTLLGSAEFGFSLSAATTSGEIFFTYRGREINDLDLAADEVSQPYYMEKGFDVTLTSDVAGTAKIYVFDAWRNAIHIKTVVFT